METAIERSNKDYEGVNELSLQNIGLGFSLCFKGCGPVPACSNHNQMDSYITATEVATLIILSPPAICLHFYSFLHVTNDTFLTGYVCLSPCRR